MAILLLSMTRGGSLPVAVMYLWAVGIACLLIGWSLFLRMVIELNKAFAPSKQFHLFGFRMHIDEIKQLHESLFPVSKLRTSSFLLALTGALAVAAAVLLAIRPRQ
jgi:hypothetical protein